MRFALLLVLFTTMVRAQTAPPQPLFEAGVNYTYNTIATSDSSDSNQSGASLHAEYFFQRSAAAWGGRSELGINGEFGGSGNTSGRLYTYLFGPRWGVEWRHLNLYGGVAAGGAHVFASNSFAVATTSGLNLLLGQHFVLRLIQVDELGFEVPDPATGRSHWRGDMRLSGGIAFRLHRH